MVGQSNSSAPPGLVPRSSGPLSLSVVIPCFNEEDVLSELRRRLLMVLDPLGLPFEIILVDDGSRDSTWNLLSTIQQQDSRFKVIRLSRNYGHQIALSCGLDQAKGQVVAIMDADLQDPPELITEMLVKWREGYDVVYGKRIMRHGEPLSKRFFAYVFYRTFRRLTGFELPSDTGDFRLMDRRAVDAFCTMPERHRFIRGMVSWLGFHQTPVFYERPERFAGSTKYPFKKSLFLALDGITSFSYAPLRMASYVGLMVSVLAFIYIFVVIGLKIAGINFSGYTSIMGAILLLGGVQLVVLGIMGEYVGRIFVQGQNRPLYLIDHIQGEPLASILPDEILPSDAPGIPADRL